MLGLRLDTGLPLAEAERSVDPAALGRVERLGLRNPPCRRGRTVAPGPDSAVERSATPLP